MCGKREGAAKGAMAIFLGNCKVEFPSSIEFERKASSIQFNIPERGSLRISAESQDGQYVVLNPKNIDDEGNVMLTEVLELYKRELPSMSFSAGSTKRSPFLKKSVTNGKYCTLAFQREEKVIGAITYQTVPFNTCYAEIPLAAVHGDHQRQGLGTKLYAELRKRLCDVGVSIIYCWADIESNDFWTKQGFEMIGKTDDKGTLPDHLTLKPALQKAMCNPGNASLMVSHLTGVNNNPGAYHTAEKPSPKTPGLVDVKCTVDYDIEPYNMYPELQDAAGPKTPLADKTEPVSNVMNVEIPDSEEEQEQIVERLDEIENSRPPVPENVKKRQRSRGRPPKQKAKKLLKGCTSQNPSETRTKTTSDNENRPDPEEVNSQPTSKVPDTKPDVPAMEKMDANEAPIVMFMNLRDEVQRLQLTKYVEELGGTVTLKGSQCTHLLTVQIRPTENFCTALSSGAWILNPEWLKASVAAHRFADPRSFILKDDKYKSFYRMDIEEVVKRAIQRPRSLFRGYTACMSPSIETRFGRLIEFAGGKVLTSLPKVLDDKLFVIAGPMDEDSDFLAAVRKLGIRHIFDTVWLVTSIMKQQLNPPFDAE